MNVYDFDNTILHGDSTARFYAYCLRHCPKMWLDLPGQLGNAVLFVLKLRKLPEFKQRMLGFLKYIDDVDDVVDAFWRVNFRRVKAWYFEKRHPDDVVISASPQFLIMPACARLGVACAMGSPVDKRTGRFLGPNCRDAEKVRRFREIYPDGEIDEFFSDSHSDDPLATLAKRAWLVKGEKLLDWNAC